MTATATLITGLYNGDVSIYRTPLCNSHSHTHAHAQRIHFQLLKRFHAHTHIVTAVHIHATTNNKPIFATSSLDSTVKIWRLKDVIPLLIKRIEYHPFSVHTAKYSHSGLLLTGCGDCVLRMYGTTLRLLWSCKLATRICSVAWSPSNHFACFFQARSGYYFVQVWDSSTFHTRFKHKQDNAFYCNYSLSFASDDLLLCSGGTSRNLYAYNIAKNKVTAYSYYSGIRAIMSLSSELVCTSCLDGMLRVYELHGTELRLLATLPYEWCSSLVSCLCPSKDTGYVLASAHWSSMDVRISVTSRFNLYWVREVTKIMLNSKVLPFCRDVHKIIWRYL